jgi:hypothetical protein
MKLRTLEEISILLSEIQTGGSEFPSKDTFQLGFGKYACLRRKALQKSFDSGFVESILRS